jgi:hypothetical protein
MVSREKSSARSLGRIFGLDGPDFLDSGPGTDECG